MKNNRNKYIYILIGAILIIALVCLLIGIFNRENKENQITTRQNDNPSIITDTTEAFSKVDKTEWNLILVNRWNPVPTDYEVTLKQLQNGYSVDERCYSDLQNMMDACRADGLEPVICSAYRAREKQEELFNNQISKWKANGYSDEKAREQAATLVAVPGTSEHQLGLALDIVDISNQVLDEEQENTPVQKWLMKNSWKYGFILRYPTAKSDITGISYEPWHYRYVGKKAAKEIYDADICLEEYLES